MASFDSTSEQSAKVFFRKICKKFIVKVSCYMVMYYKSHTNVHQCYKSWQLTCNLVWHSYDFPCLVNVFYVQCMNVSFAHLPVSPRPVVSFLSSILRHHPLPESLHPTLTTPTATPTNCYPLRSQLLQFLLPTSEVRGRGGGGRETHLEGAGNGLPAGMIKLANRYIWALYPLSKS